ncbi:MAG: LuxR family transcriptional regulator [Caldilinea sp. CFX5]|nr:LuxR family transcriptional regulator [Caldilinea sp. CFX5]
MNTPILATKLYLPAPRPKVVARPHLITRLNAGLHRKMTLVSAAAGFGKTTLVSEWVNQKPASVAWLSLDEADNDPTRFLTYLVAALQTVAPKVGAGVLALLQAPQPPAPATLLTALLNEITTIPDKFILVLDDYHLIEDKAIDQALTFLIEHLPAPMHLVIATRADPDLPLARLRARDQLTEVRAADLRFTPAEAADFLNQVMGLALTPAAIAALEKRTEGWVAGLQLAALSLQGQQVADPQHVNNFIHAFTGSHRFVLDYLLEEVLHQQPEPIQTFLLHTAILDRLCGPLCDAVLGKDEGGRHARRITEGMKDELGASSFILEQLERANLFIVPLDNERRWYRYHHLFAELLRQRLQQRMAASTTAQNDRVAALHIRASVWYEVNGLELEAFHHAVAAHDIGRADRLIEGKGMPLHFRVAAVPILNWLKSLPTTVLDTWPRLWTVYASVALVMGHITGAEEKLQAAEAALQNPSLQPMPDEMRQDLVGRIAAIRATAAASQNQAEAIITHSQRALGYLHPDNLAFRTSTIWKLGYAYHLQNDRVAAGRAYREVIATGEASGNRVFVLLAAIGLGHIQELETQLHLAAQTNRRILEQIGEQPLPAAGVTYLGLARIHYEWNDLAAAQQYAQQGRHLAQQMENKGQFVAGEVLHARLQLAQGDVTGAAARLAAVEPLARQHNLAYQRPDFLTTQVVTLLRQGHWADAAQIAQSHSLAIAQARVYLAQGDPAAALTGLAVWRRQVEAKGWADERLKVLILQALAHQAQGEPKAALPLLGEALALAEPEGFVRIFVDEGQRMAELLRRMKDEGGRMKVYVDKLLAALDQPEALPLSSASLHPFVEPLSQRELEVLQLIAQGLSNDEISKRLFLALSTVKGHNRIIFDKLQVQRRTEAVARARALGLL